MCVYILMYVYIYIYIYAYMHRFVYTSIDQYTYLYMHEQGSVINLLCNMCWISQRHGKVKTWFALDAITLIPFDIIELALNAQEVAVRPGLGRVGTWHSPKIYPKETCSLGQPTFFGIFAQIVEALISLFSDMRDLDFVFSDFQRLSKAGVLAVALPIITHW